MHRESGFTLYELMITLAVFAILMAIAVPSFTGVIERNKARSAANDLLATILVARSEAIKRERQTAITRASGSDWTHWQAFVDNDQSRTFTNGDELLTDHQVDTGKLAISATGAPLANTSNPGLFFDTRGTPAVALSTPAYFTVQSGDVRYYVCLSATGRPRFSEDLCQ